MADVRDLDGCRLKLARADKHLQTLHNEIEWFLHRHPQRFALDRDPETGEELLWTLVSNPPEEWSAIIGDVLYNLRSCLDHLAWQLVLLAGNDPTKQTAFPVFKADPFAARANKDMLALWNSKVHRMEPVDVATIKELQPYTRGDEFWQHPLHLVHTMNNWDKHQQLHLTSRQFRYAGVEFDWGRTKDRSNIEITPFRPLDARAAAIPFVRSEGHMQMKVHAPFDVGFREDDWIELKVRETMIQLANFVLDVVNEFEPRFRDTD